MMMPARDFRPGERVRVSRLCPIDFGEMGPEPGDIGRVIAVSRSNDLLRLCAVRFESVCFEWLIPEVFLELMRQDGHGDTGERRS